MRHSQTDDLTAFLQRRLDVLVDKSIAIAKSNGYAPFTTTIRAAWVEAIVSVTDSIAEYLGAAPSGTPATGPLATSNYASDPRFTRMRLIAQRHRSLGITLELYIGLFKHFRNLFLNEMADMPGGLDSHLADRVRDFFDETELSITADWTHTNDNKRLRELQARTRSITLDKDRYFAVFESLQTPAFLLDHSENLVNANQASAELFLGSDAQAGDVIYLRSMRSRRKSLQDVVTKIMRASDTEEDVVWLDTLDGRRCFDIHTRTLHDAVENIALGFVVLLSDVTTHHLKATEAQQSERGMSRFLATMSHEIRTPLHSVLGAVELLRTADHANADGFLDVIEGAGTGLLQTLNNVLDYSKFENAPPVARPKMIDLVQEVEGFERIQHLGRNRQNTALGITMGAEVPRNVCIDWGMTRQVLSNLVSNALKADPGGRVQVSVDLVGPDRTGAGLRFAVRDHGPGFPDGSVQTVFCRFSDVMARDTGNGGSGLGLAISHHLVQAMGGQIGVRNLEQGAVVWFEIPAVTPVSEPEPRRDPVAAPRDQVQSCLLVDDDPIGSLVTGNQLEALGLKVTYAHSVAEARQAATQPFDVYVVDFLLPDGNGPCLTAELRQGNPAARFLALTANVEALADRETAFDRILAKPADRNSLANAVFGDGGQERVKSVRKHTDIESLSGLSTETISAMVEAFSASWAQFRTALNSPVTRPEDLALLAHRLSGSCVMLGIEEPVETLATLEAQCASGPASSRSPDHIRPLDVELSSFPSWQRLLGEIR